MKKQKSFSLRSMAGAVLLAALVLFIWSRSLADSAQSHAESDILVGWLSALLDGRIATDTLSFYVRKTAHFAEYSALGLAAGFLFLRNRRCVQNAANGLFLCLGVAVLDESIQLLSDRSAQVCDILLDFSGALFGMTVYCLLHILIRSRRRS